MPATQDRATTVISFKGNDSISAYRVVRATGTRNQVALYDTSTSLILGVTTQDCPQSDAASAVAINGTCRVVCAASVSCGAMIKPDPTGTGMVIESANSYSNTAASLQAKTLGIALQAGSTGTVIEVLLMINNISKIG